MKTRIPSAKERREADNARAKRAALKALRRARKAAEIASVKLSDWEGEFLGSVENAGRAIWPRLPRPGKRRPGTALSMLQALKLKEIAGKAKGGKSGLPRQNPLA